MIINWKHAGFFNKINFTASCTLPSTERIDYSLMLQMLEQFLEHLLATLNAQAFANNELMNEQTNTFQERARARPQPFEKYSYTVLRNRA